jgi:hypothetical protein
MTSASAPSEVSGRPTRTARPATRTSDQHHDTARSAAVGMLADWRVSQPGVG